MGRSSCLSGRDQQATGERDAPAASGPAWGGSYDYEYERNGVSNLFMLFAPLEGWRRVEVTDRRTKADWARVVKQLVDEDYPHKDRIVLVMDNLNTHHPASLYEAFEPAEARRIAERLSITLGSWLDNVPTMPGPPHSRSKNQWQRGRLSAIRTAYEWTGALPPRMHASN